MSKLTDNKLAMYQLAKLTGGELIGDGRGMVKHIATDSRALPGISNVIFVAISGLHHDGNQFIQEVYNRGIKFFLTERKPSLDLFPDATFCIVKDALIALQRLAADKRAQFTGTVIGISGSNGKTIVKEWIYQILQHDRSVFRSPRSYNSQLGVPLSVWQLSKKYDTAIIEAGISLPGEMKNLQKIIRPDIGILTNIGPAHSENFKTYAHKLQEKLKLFEACKKLIFRSEQRIDGKSIDQYLSGWNIELVSWSLTNKASYTYKIIDRSSDGIKLKLSRSGKETNFKIPFLDDASLENALHVITALSELGMDLTLLNTYLNQLEPIEMRLETLKGVYGSTLVNDVYNSDLAGLGVALDILMQQTKHRKKILILSDVYQSGLEPKVLYAEVAELIKFKQINRIYCIGENISQLKELFPEGTRFFPDTETFLKSFDLQEITDASVLIKGARKFHFEEITKLLQLQLHTTVLEINVNELIHNLNYFRSLIEPECKIMVMVKALSYGSGAHEIAGFLQYEKVDYLAVAFPDEGIQLRQSGVNLPIMVMNTGLGDFRQLLEYRLEPEIFSREGLLTFINECSYLGLSDQPIHIKLDTGMHRLGFENADLEWLLNHLASEEIFVASIFSHLVGSDEETLDTFTLSQVKLFLSMAEKLKKVTGKDTMLHILNSAGTERFPEFQMDMVRIGIGLYGQGRGENLLPVSKYITRISQLRQVSKGDTVGYGRKGRVKKDSVIATIPVGYADGIDRRLGNGNYSFYIEGEFAQTVGNICMDMTMLDITGIDATVGDKVELFGKNCPVSGMAKALETIEYEILTSIPERVKRIYIRE